MESIPPPNEPNPGPISRIGKFRSLLRKPAIRQRILAPIGFNVAILATNLVTGVVVARLLGPQGRGEVTAILLLAQTASWIFSMGGAEAISYRLAREPSCGSALLGSWLLATIPLTLIAIGIPEIFLPVLFGAQTDQAIEFARVFLILVVPIMVTGIFTGMLLGDEDFLNYNIVRLVSPLFIAVCYLLIEIFGHFDVEEALFVNAFGTCIGLFVAARATARRHGIGRPDWKLLRETFWYGVRAHAGSLAGIVNARLDLLIIPAFLGAASIGLYSVATNTTSIISSLTSTVGIFVLPVAVRRETTSARTVIRTLHAVLLISLAIAIPLAILAEFALTLVYGSDFGAAATTMRILLPGTVLDAGVMVLLSGLLAANRPFLSSLAGLPAGVLTVAGLLIFLRHGGIEVAAIVTTVAYSVTFFVALAFYKSVAKLRWRDFVVTPKGVTPVASGPAPDA